MGKSTIPMAIFSSKLLVYQRVQYIATQKGRTGKSYLLSGNLT